MAFHFDRLLEAHAKKCRRDIAALCEQLDARCLDLRRAWLEIDPEQVTPAWFRDQLLYRIESFLETDRQILERTRQIVALLDTRDVPLAMLPPDDPPDDPPPPKPGDPDFRAF